MPTWAISAGADPARLVRLVLPALFLNYFGQGALLLSDPSALDNPFYQLAPDWFHYPLVAFATVATVSPRRPSSLALSRSRSRRSSSASCRG